MTRRFSDAITPDNPVRAYNLPFEARTLSITNSSPYSVYVNIGNASTPTAASRSAAVPPFSSYTADPGGAISFGVFVDHAGDPTPAYVYPIIVTFSEAAGEVSAPLSNALPATLQQPYLKLILQSAQAIGASPTQMNWQRWQYTYQGGGTFGNLNTYFTDTHIWRIDVSLILNSLAGGITSIRVDLLTTNPNQTLATSLETPASSQTTTTHTFSKIARLLSRQAIALQVTLTGSAPTASADPTSTMTLSLLN